MFRSSFQRLERGWSNLLVCAVMGAVVAIGISLVLPKQYSSTMRLLVTQANVAGLDPYTALKSTEQIAGNVRELVYSSLVANKVLSDTQGIDASYFSQNENDRRKEWQKTVEVAVVPGTGILTATVYHPDREQAQRLVQGVAKAIIDQAPNFGYNAQAKIIDTPLPSRWFVRPDIVMNAIYGAAFGLILAVIWLLLGIDYIKRR
jgi:capsular polysaccharide biosynthesis protein